MNKFMRTACIGMAIGLVPGVVAAGQSSEPFQEQASESANEIMEKTENAYEHTKEWLALKRDEYQAVVARKLDDIDAGMERLNQRLEQHAQGAKSGFQEMMSDLREKREAAVAKFEELKDSTEDRWEDFKAGVNEAVASLAEAYDRAKSEFAPEA